MITATDFEEKYISMRKKENRFYSDHQVRWLPEIEESHPHFKEWLIRRNSCDKLSQHLLSKKKELNILEVGCGNGWLGAQLAKIPGTSVVGIDINRTEIEQARRVFAEIENLEFFYGGIANEDIADEQFDVIVFAASIQYFAAFDGILHSALQRLAPKGEIHIIDSFFYQPSDVAEARKRTAEYFRSIDFSEMTKHYFHRSLAELTPYQHKILNNPSLLMNRLSKNRNPFHWICINQYV